MPNCCSKLTPFQKLLLIQVFRPEKVQSEMINYVSNQLGIKSISGINQTFKNIADH